MHGLLRSHKLGLLVLAVALTFALSATAGFGWGTTEQPQQDKSGEHVGKDKDEGEGKEGSKGHGESGDKEEGKDHGKPGKGEEEEEEEHGQPGPTGAAGPVGGGTTVNNQVTNNNTNTNTNTVTVNNQAQAEAEAKAEAETQVQAESESEEGPEVAQVDTDDGQPPSQPSQGSQPAELASTGFNAGALAGLGALCIGASLLLFRRRRSA